MISQQNQAEMGLRMECLRLACAVSKDTEKADVVTLKAESFFEYVMGEPSSIVPALTIPKIITQ